MPEGPEVKILSDYINHHSKGKTFTKVYHVQKGNIPEDSGLIENFKLESESNGKELVLKLYHDVTCISISVFMGMSGNWLYTPTDDWQNRKFTRLRLDTTDGNSLLLWGLYMGPKYRVGGFTGVKRGPDPIKEFQKFKKNILQNLDKVVFHKPICEILLDQKYFNGIGAYLTAEIIGRVDINPFKKFSELSKEELEKLLKMIRSCSIDAYNYGGGELLDWNNPFGSSRIGEWIKYYGKENCYKQKFGSRNIWIDKKWKID